MTEIYLISDTGFRPGWELYGECLTPDELACRCIGDDAVIINIDGDEEPKGNPGLFVERMKGALDQRKETGDYPTLQIYFRIIGVGTKVDQMEDRGYCLGSSDERKVVIVPSSILHVNRIGELDPRRIPNYKGRPLVALCVIFRDVSEGLERMLESVSGIFDEIVLVSTGDPGQVFDYTSHSEQLIYSHYRCPNEVTLSDGSKCIGNFSDARQYAFSLCTATWRMFLDADDELVWLGPRVYDEASSNDPDFRRMIRHLPKDTNEVALPYYYDENTIQMRGCLWRWYDDQDRQLWRWDGAAVHERVVETGWNEGKKLVSFWGSGSVFAIKHHAGDGHIERSLERNYRIAKQALEAPESVPAIAEARLVHTVAIQDLANGDPKAPYGLRRVVEVYPTDPYGFLAMLDLAKFYTLTHQFYEANALLYDNLDYWGDQPEVHLQMARIKVGQGKLPTAAECFAKAYRIAQDESRGQMRTDFNDLHIVGRFEAVDCFLKLGMFDHASDTLEVAPPLVKGLREWKAWYIKTGVARGDRDAAQAAATVAKYLLSVDNVKGARALVETLPLPLRCSSDISEIDWAIERRLRHFEPGQTVYEVLNDMDLSSGIKVHQEPLAYEILELRPDIYVDYGCNTGGLCLVIKQVLPDCRVIGVDLSKKRIDESKDKAQIANVDCEFYTTEEWSDHGWDLLFSKKRGDRIVVSFSEVIEHILETPRDILPLDDEDIENHELDVHYLVTTPDVEAYENLSIIAKRPDLSLSKFATMGSEGAEHVRSFSAHELIEEIYFCFRAVPVDIARLNFSMKDHRTLLFVHARYQLEPWDRSKPRIDIYAEGYLSWGPRAHIEGHAGGSEQAVIHLAPALSELGYEVHVYASPMERQDFSRDVWWHHLKEFRPWDNRHALIVWRNPSPLLYFHKHARGRFPIYFWSHDVPEELAIHKLESADQIWALSQFHKKTFTDLGVDPSRIAVLQNGVCADEIRAIDHKPTKHSIFYGSSVDRGLLLLLRMWPTIRERFPQATLYATYRRDLLRHHAAGSVKAKVAFEVEGLAYLLREQGVTLFDGLDHESYLKLAAGCDVWAYPCVFPEISCIVAMEMQALGLKAVTTSYAALRETVLDHRWLVDWSVVEKEILESGALNQGGAIWFPENCSSPSYLTALFDALDSPSRMLVDDALALYDWNRTAALFKSAIEGKHGNQFRGQVEPK